MSGPLYLATHVQTCKNENCSNNKRKIFAEEESLLAIKNYKYGLDVILEVGQQRYKKYQKWQEIQKSLAEKHNLEVSEREIGYLEQSYLALVKIVAKGDKALEELKELDGLILAIDGIKPDASNEVLYLIREVQTGQIVAGRMIDEKVKENLGLLIQEVIDLGFKIIGVVSDKEESIVSAVKKNLPEIPHQLCHYHYLKNVALPVMAADRELKKTYHSL